MSDSCLRLREADLHEMNNIVCQSVDVKLDFFRKGFFPPAVNILGTKAKAGMWVSRDVFVCVCVKEESLVKQS